jgi:hypothetical protein
MFDIERRRCLVRGLTIAATAAELVGCTVGTGPVFDAAAMPPLEPGKSRVIVLFDQLVKSVQNFWRRVSIDGQPVGDIGKGEFIVLDLKPGTKVVAVEMRNAGFKSGFGPAYTTSVQARVGQTAYVLFIGNLVVGPLSQSGLEPVNEESALRHLNGMRRANLGVWHEAITGKVTATDMPPDPSINRYGGLPFPR